MIHDTFESEGHEKFFGTKFVQIRFLLLRYGQPNTTLGFDAIAATWSRGREISRRGPTLRSRSRLKLSCLS